MADLIPRYIEHPKFPIKPALYRILVYVGMAVLITLGFFLNIPPSNIVIAEIVWAVFIACFEIWREFKLSKK